MRLQETEEFYSSAKLTQKVGEQYKKMCFLSCLVRQSINYLGLK